MNKQKGALSIYSVLLTLLNVNCTLISLSKLENTNCKNCLQIQAIAVISCMSENDRIYDINTSQQVVYKLKYRAKENGEQNDSAENTERTWTVILLAVFFCCLF
jgi:hypothetical protein